MIFGGNSGLKVPNIDRRSEIGIDGFNMPVTIHSVYRGVWMPPVNSFLGITWADSPGVPGNSMIIVC